MVLVKIFDLQWPEDKLQWVRIKCLAMKVYTATCPSYIQFIRVKALPEDFL